MRSHAPSFARLGAFWFGIQAVWGAVLGLSLQARTNELGGAGALATYGAIATLGAIAAGVTQIAIGPIADYARARGRNHSAFVVGGAVVAAGALWEFYGSQTIAAELAAFLTLQFAMNVAAGPYQAIIPEYVGGERAGLASSWTAALQSAGNAAGAVIAAFVANAKIVAAALAVLLLSTAAMSVAHIRSLPLERMKPGAFRVSRTFADLFVSRALVFVGFYTMVDYLYFYVVRTLGVLPAHATQSNGVALLAFTLFGVAGAALAGRPSDQFDRRLIACGACAISIVALAVLCALPRAGVFFSAAAVMGFAWGAFLTADWALACVIVPRDSLATAFGVWNVALLAPQIVAPSLTTLVLALSGATHGPAGPRFALGLAAAEFALGAAWLWRLPAQPPRGVKFRELGITETTISARGTQSGPCPLGCVETGRILPSLPSQESGPSVTDF
ncbi:MAG: MFS transporter [Candidatus Eremiobacteraeota bacterium]|nr:MFS transporter [Candidatus Eremiobacteraeota bacterium]